MLWETTLKLDRRRVLFGVAAAGFVALASPVLVRADDDANNDDDDPRDYRNGSGYRNNHENRPNGNPRLNNVTDQPGMSYQQSLEAGGESRETVHESAIKPVHYWLTEAMSANATEVEAGRLAQDRGASPDVRQFGQRMVADHSMALEELVLLARENGLDPIRGPLMPEHRQLIQNLSSRSGQDFDRFYMRSMVLEHETDIAHYQEGVNEQSRDVAAHAAKTLPILREHLMMAQDIARRVGADLTGT